MEPLTYGVILIFSGWSSVMAPEAPRQLLHRRKLQSGFPPLFSDVRLVVFRNNSKADMRVDF